MSRHYLACEFKPGGRRYTYHHDAPPAVAIGDLVQIETRNGTIQRITVADISIEPPPYETKPILGLADLASADEQSKEN